MMDEIDTVIARPHGGQVRHHQLRSADAIADAMFDVQSDFHRVIPSRLSHLDARPTSIALWCTIRLLEQILRRSAPDDCARPAISRGRGDRAGYAANREGN